MINSENSFALEVKKLGLAFSKINIEDKIKLINDASVSKLFVSIIEQCGSVVNMNDVDKILKNSEVMYAFRMYCEHNNIEYTERKTVCYNNDITKMYLQEMDQNNLFTPEEEKNAFMKYKQYPTEANREAIVVANLRLVVKVAMHYAYRAELADIIQYGNLGLMRAVEEFDVTRGYKFSTYAIWWIRQSIARGISKETRAVRVPIHLEPLVWECRKLKTENPQLSLEQIMEQLNVSTNNYNRIRKAMLAMGIYSLDAQVSNGEDGDLLWVNSVGEKDAGYEQVEYKIYLADIIKSAYLDEREQKILELRYGLKTGYPMSLEEVGKIFSLTRERIRQIEAKALIKMRKVATRHNSLKYSRK